LDGHDSSDFAQAVHNHDDVYYKVGDKVADADKLDGKNSSDFAAANHDHDSYLKSNYSLLPWFDIVEPNTTLEIENYSGGDVFDISYQTVDSEGNKSPNIYVRGYYHQHIRLWFNDDQDKWFVRNTHSSQRLFIVVRNFSKI